MTVHSPLNVDLLVGTGGIGSGVLFDLLGEHTLGREESRAGALRQARDYCKLHIICHYFAALLPPGKAGKVRILPVGKVGEDAPGLRVLEEMGAAGMDLSRVERVASAPTLYSVCFLYPDGTGGNITASNSASAVVGPEDLDGVALEMAAHRGRGIALAAPEVPLAARARLLSLGTEHDFLRVAVFTSGEMAEVRQRGLLAQVDLLAMNTDEAAALAGLSADADLPAIRDGCLAVLTAANPGLMFCLTAGSAGSWGWRDGEWEFTPPLPVEVKGTAGAGDAYLAGVMAAMAAGADLIHRPPRTRRFLADDALRSACDLGSLAAGLAVTSEHTIHPGLDAMMVRRYAEDNGLCISFSC